ncbi:MAG TPA: phosphotransferase [Anaerolineales bacterium]|nr:phosphotransferase [Anaerolineales bacterium]
MGEDILEKLMAIDPTILTYIVRQDQNDLAFDITDWTAKRLSDKGGTNPDGLWLFSGQGNSDKGSRHWSVVLKILQRQHDELPADNVWHWKRESSWAQSGLSKQLQGPGPVKAPRIYHSEETPEGAWIWMEHVQGTRSGPWTLDEYAFAAHQFGLWNGSYLTGSSLPSEPWLARQHYRAWLAIVDFEGALRFPLNQKYIPGETLARYERLWYERETFFNALESLPQVFSHFDSHRRNLLIRTSRTNQKELVALDWGECGVGAIGAELNWLIGYSAMLLEWPPAELPSLEEVAFPSYIQGLRESGWKGNTDLVRLGFTAMLAVYLGCAHPGLAANLCAAENREVALRRLGFAEDELFLRVLPGFDYVLDRADAARTLLKKLGLA